MIAALLLSAFVQAAGATPAPHEQYQKGIELLDQGEWGQALPLYRDITRTNPVYGWGWMGLGWSLHYTGDCRAALPAYQRALELGGLPPYRVLLEIARCQVALDDQPAAIATIARALEAGFPSRDRLRSDAALAPLHATAAFRALFGDAGAAGSATRADGWRSDLDLLQREIGRIHYSAKKAFAPGELGAVIGDLKARASSASDDELTIGLMKVLRRLGDGHTYAEPEYMRSGAAFAAVPLRFAYFEDGIFITATDAAHEEILWSRLTAIEDTPVADVYARLAALAPQDNAWRPRSVVPDYLAHPQLLKAIGVTGSADRMAMTVVDRAGNERTVTVDVQHGPAAALIRQPSSDAPPLAKYAANLRDWYWFEMMPEARTMYVQYNACANKQGESLEAFSARLASALEADDVDRLVIDLRWNGGGNNFLNRPLLETITRARQNRRGALFVIAGPHTFSAAMIFAAQLERYTHAIFVGEPTGSSPNFVGETTFVTLPNTRIVVSLSNLYWQTSSATDARPWIPPMLYVPETFAAFRARRDPALDAILAYPR